MKIYISKANKHKNPSKSFGKSLACNPLSDTPYLNLDGADFCCYCQSNINTTSIHQ
jgi:hypothetical protein